MIDRLLKLVVKLKELAEIRDVALRNPRHLKTKYALPEIREDLGNRSESGIPKQLATRPCDVRTAKAATAQ